MTTQSIASLVSISKGNIKMGRTPSFSLPPIISCMPGVPCIRACYALRMAKRHPIVDAAWHRNWDCVQRSIPETMGAIHGYLVKHQSPYFRWHVSGDIFSLAYFAAMLDMAHRHPETQFLAFTKRRDLQDTILACHAPSNLTIRFSNFLNLRFDPAPLTATYVPKGQTPTGFACPGKCMSCRACWNQDVADVQFLHH